VTDGFGTSGRGSGLREAANLKQKQQLAGTTPSAEDKQSD